MKCTLCGYEYKESEAAHACKGCSLIKGCHLVKCPNCGFEMPPEPKWAKFLEKRRETGETK